MLAIAVPGGMALFFSLLGATFDYPAVMDRPSGAVLTRLGHAGDGVVVCWLGATLCALLLIPLVLGLGAILRDGIVGDAPGGRRGSLSRAITAAGVLAAACMAVDLSQWVWLYPHLGRSYVDPGTTGSMRTELEGTWAAFHRYVGVGTGIYAATLCSALWAAGSGWVLLRVPGRRAPLAWLALGAGVLFLASIAPGVGFGGYSSLNTAGFGLWALWLAGSGLVLLFGGGTFSRSTADPTVPDRRRGGNDPSTGVNPDHGSPGAER